LSSRQKMKAEPSRLIPRKPTEYQKHCPRLLANSSNY